MERKSNNKNQLATFMKIIRMKNEFNKRWIIMIILLMGYHIGNTQFIARKGNLGIAAAPAPTNDHGAILSIAEVSANSTASSLGMSQHDMLLEINGIIIDEGQKLRKAIDEFMVGKTVTAKVIRDQKIISLKGIVQGRPVFKKPNHEIQLLEIPFRDGYTRGYLTHPSGKGPYPTIYYIQGYACQSVNIHPMDPNLQLINVLVDHGYAILRVEKPGMGEHYNLNPCESYDFDDEVESFMNGLDLMRNHELVLKDEIYLFGHSLGGNQAALLGSQPDIAGVMVYGTFVKPWIDYLEDMAMYSLSYSKGASTVNQNLPTLKSALRKLYEKQMSHQSLTDEEKKLMTSWFGYDPKGILFTRSIDFWTSLNKYNFLNEWAKVKAPVLALHGGSDAQAISALDAELLTQSINENQPNQATFKLIDSTNHGYAKVSTRTQELEFLNKGMAPQIAFSNFNGEVPAIIIDWLNSIKKSDEEQVFSIAPKVIIPALSNRSSMDVVSKDMNGDGYDDLIVATEFGPNQLLLYDEGIWKEDKPLPQLKAYTAPMLGEDSEDIAVADFDKDGDLDLLFVSEDSEHHELLYNDGKGQFIHADHQIPKLGQANAVLVYDFNNDGWEDVLLGIKGQNELYINQKGKKFALDSEKWLVNADHTQDLIAVDLDNDSDLDIVEAVEQGGNNLYINENGKFVEQSNKLPLPQDMESRKVIADDFDLDGDMDLFFCNVGWTPNKNPQNQLLQNDGTGNFENITKRLPIDNTTTLDAVFLDINEDGHKDIVTTNFVNDKKVKVFVAQLKNGELFYEERDGLLPIIDFTGGVSLIRISNGEKEFLYFGNFRSADVLLQRH